FSRPVDWTNGRPDDALRDFSVVVVGAGISGICAAIYLERLGIEYTVLERQNGVGGTWELNDYPGARVDLSNFIYQFKFEKNYPW
ncbi:FAD-dependent oxidoreductase, partial [Rhizobium johnstonii]|uniref:FAD-dependent oxidoreductase n=1 Tax=Rhizobium johnstonii TaxID=3019933 RepID=UPI003F9CACC5